MDKKYQVFISSTYTDLVEARAKVRDAILSIYHFPVGMELFGAADEEQWEIISETIDTSDYYVLILGQRYGSVIPEGPDAGISYTEKEFRYALEKGVPVLAFIIDDSVPVKPDDIERENTDKLTVFKNTVKQGRLVEWWKNPDDLALKVTAALYKQINRKKRSGWIRGDSVDVEKSLAEIVELGKQNKELQEENRKLSEEIEQLKAAANRKPLLTVTMDLTEPDDDEKHPEFYHREDLIKIWDEDGILIVHMKLKELSTSEKESEYKPLYKSDIPAELGRYILEKDIMDYNATLPSSEILNQYLEKYRIFLRLKENGIPVTFFVNNLGTKKATDVTVTVEFPNQVSVFRFDDIPEIPEPKAPKKPDDPINKAYKKFNHERAVALDIDMSQLKRNNVRPDLSSLLTTPFKNGNTIYSTIEIKNNIVEIEQKQGIVHTKSDWFSGAYIVPTHVGEYEAKVTLMCAEYENQEETVIRFIVEE